MSAIQRTHGPERTDSRALAERKASVVMRKAELTTQLHAVETAEAEIDRLIEADERARERERTLPRTEGRYATAE